MKAVQGFIILIKKPYRMLFVIAGFALFLGLSYLHSAYDSKNYRETTGEICNVTQREVLWHGRYVTRYSYDLKWYADGKVYKEHYTDMFDREPEGEIPIWVSDDNRDVKKGNFSGIVSGAFRYLAVSLAAGLLGALLYRRQIRNRKESDAERIERIEDRKLYSVIVFLLSLCGIGLVAFDAYKEYQSKNMVSAISIDMLIAFLVIAIGAVIVFALSKTK